jgi:hypothetical protein
MKGWQKAFVAGAVVAGAGVAGYFYMKVHAESLLKEEFRKMGDVNGDGIIDDKDLSLLQAAFGSTPGMPNWNPKCDLNGDGKVDGKDLAIASMNYGLTFEEWLKTKGYSKPLSRRTAQKLPLIKEI